MSFYVIKHTAKALQDLLKVKKWDTLQWPNQSLQLLKTKVKVERPTNKQQLKAAAGKALQSINTGEIHGFQTRKNFDQSIKNLYI